MSAPPPSVQRKTIVLTGATGYVGGQLLPRLLEAGHEVRCVVRDPDRADLPDGARVIGGDVLDGDGLDEAAAGADVAYYLVHSMGGSDTDEDFAARDRRAAHTSVTRWPGPLWRAPSTSAAWRARAMTAPSICAAASRSPRCWPTRYPRSSTSVPP
ncbi:MAG TPA: NAD(P)H-binding protein [Baekduia sp.]|nr:NAD(P)H-binding protein [Baekduia sp.]